MGKEEGTGYIKICQSFLLLSLYNNYNFQLIKSDSSILNLIENLKRRGILLRDCRSFMTLDENGSE